MTALLLLLLCAAPARASGLPEFEAAFAEARAAVLARPLSLGMVLKARIKPRPKAVKRVADPEAWARMLERARRSPTLTQELRVGDTDYKVSALVFEAAVEGQQCSPGAKPRNALYVADAVSGPGGAVYPVRLASVCVEPALTVQLLAVDADADGSIQDASIADPGKGRFLHPMEENLTPAQQARFDSYLAALASLFAGGS